MSGKPSSQHPLQDVLEMASKAVNSFKGCNHESIELGIVFIFICKSLPFHHLKLSVPRT